MSLIQTAKVTTEGVSLLTILGSLLQYLPAWAALMSIIWYAVLLYDRFKKDKKDRKKR